MEVVDGLAPFVASVKDDAVAAVELSSARGVRGYGQQMAEQGRIFGGCLCLRGDVLFGDDEQMGGGLRADVGEDDAEVVFVYAVCGDRTLYDFAE
jgi:hypothetical protein